MSKLKVLTQPIDLQTELLLYQAGIELRDRFPDTYIRLYIVNPRLYEGLDLDGTIPVEAEEISLTAAPG